MLKRKKVKCGGGKGVLLPPSLAIVLHPAPVARRHKKRIKQKREKKIKT